MLPGSRHAACAILLSLCTPARAHRLDEYLEATLISIERQRAQFHITLTPGVAVLPAVLALIDTDRDGLLSPSEQQAYTSRVVGDLSLTIDGQFLSPRLISVTYPSIAQMNQGLGEIQMELEALLPPGPGSRKLVLENRHQPQLAAFQVNCLAPGDPGIRITSQKRNYSQSIYELEYLQSEPAAWWSATGIWLAAGALLLCVRLALYFRSRAVAAASRAESPSIPPFPREQ